MEEGRTVKRRKRRSIVWKYFVEEASGGLAKCTICEALIKTPNGSTSGLGRHLASNHEGGAATGARMEGATDSENPADIQINAGLPRLMRKRKQSSHVWEYFVQAESRETATCKICNTVLKTTSGATTSLLRHLESFHKTFGENSKSKLRARRQGESESDSEDGNDSSSGDSNCSAGNDSEYVANSDEASDNEEAVNAIASEGHNIGNDTLHSDDGSKVVQRRKLRSHVWEFFIPTVTRQTAKCRMCNLVIKTSHGSTTNLNRHLTVFHGGKLKSLRKKLKRRNLERKTGANRPSIVPKTETDPLDNDPDDSHSPEAAMEEADIEEDMASHIVEVAGRRTRAVSESEKSSERKIVHQLGGKACFVCNAKFSQESVPHSSQEEFRFLLTEILEIPMGRSLDYLDQLERPEKWIDLCVCCHKRLVEALEARRKIIRLQLQLESHQRQILESIKSKGKKWKVDPTKFPLKQQQVVDRIKKYVHSRNYSILTSDGNSDMDIDSRIYPASSSPIFENDDLPDPDPLESETPHTSQPNEFHLHGVLPGVLPGSSTQAASSSSAEVEIISTSTTEKLVEADHKNGSVYYSKGLRRRRLRSDVWKFFVPTVGRETAKCKLCGVMLKTSNSSTTALRRHLIAYHGKNIKALRNKMLPPSKSDASKAKKMFPGKWKTSSQSFFMLPVPCKSKSYRYRYDCPNCPKVKGYPMAQFAMHLAIHLRRPFQCTLCSDFLPMDEDIREHHWKEKHSQVQQSSNTDKFTCIKFDPGKIWKCDSCQEGFFSEEDRDTHERRCLPLAYQESRKSLSLASRNPHQCQLCQLRFRNIAEWRLHRVLSHHQVDSMSCYYCDKSFCEMTVDGVETRHEQKLADHMNGEHGAMRVYDECEPCGLIFDNRIEKKEHFEEQHGIPESKLYSCKVCGAHYSALSGLRRHLTNTHFQSGTSICDICGAKFLHQRSLLHHKFQTHGILPEGHEVLTCPEEACGFKSILQENIRRHNWSVHVAARNPFRCKFCDKGFKIKSNLRGHMEIHLNKDTKPYQCEVCGVSYAVKNYLSVHKRLAHEEKRGDIKKRYVYRRSRGESTKQATTSPEEAPNTNSSLSSTLTDEQMQPQQLPPQQYWN